MAELQPYAQSITNKQNYLLADRLPLATPHSVMVDVCNACNFSCVQCPTGDPALLKSVGRVNRIMHLDLFKKIIDGMAGFPEAVSVLHLFKDGEPLLNKKLPEMIRYAKRADVAQRIETTSNGSLLNLDLSLDLIESGLDGIRISIYGLGEKQYNETTKKWSAFDKIVENVSVLYSEKTKRNSDLQVHCKIIDMFLSEEEKSYFGKIFGDISDSIHIDSLMGWSTSDDADFTLGSNPDKGLQGYCRNETRKICSEPFSKLAVNSDGSVSVCCVDWSQETIVGDANSRPLPEIWAGTELAAFRARHLEGRRDEIGPCANCDYIKALPPYANLDDHADALKDLFPA